MAKRPAYLIENGKVIRRDYEFQWYPGFALVQKRKSIASLHDKIISENKENRPLEISTKGVVDIGIKLSAFNLKINGYTLENIYQSLKVFSNSGPYRDLLNVNPKFIKQDSRLSNSGKLVGFNYNGIDFPLRNSMFYDYIYIKSVKETLSFEEINQIINYTHFTDIVFNPKKSVSTQARSVAIIHLMLDKYKEIPAFSVSDFIRFHDEHVKC